MTIRSMIYSALVLLALASCAPRAQARCDLSVETQQTFSDAETPDTVSAQTLGPACNAAVALYVVRNHAGAPVWAWTAPMARAFGEDFHHADEDQVRGFLERWAQPQIATAADAPEWPARAASPPEGALTTLDRATYEDIRARDLPLMCHLTGVARETCIFWEPGAASAGVLYERDTYAEDGEAE